MKDWEVSILKSRTDRDTYLITNDKGSFVCTKSGSKYLVKSDSMSEILNIERVIRL